MIQRISNPKEALIKSYSKPIAYKDYILYNGVVIVRWKKAAKTS